MFSQIIHEKDVSLINKQQHSNYMKVYKSGYKANINTSNITDLCLIH